MFIISQYLLNISGTCKNINQISTYSIITGLILYASIYLYLLFYNDEYLSIFNKFLIYIIVVDLLLSTFYYFNLQKSFKYDTMNIEEYKKSQNVSDFDVESLESVDMSLVDDEISEESEQQEELQEEELQEEELQEELQEEEFQQEELQQEELQQEEFQELQELQQEHLESQLNEIDELLSIPVLEEIVESKYPSQDKTLEPEKVKAKRKPRIKKESLINVI